MRWLLVLALCAACKAKSADKQTTSGPARISNHALATTPLQNVSSKAGTIAFTIDLPSTTLKPPEVSGAYSTWEPREAWFDTPSFTVLYNDMPWIPDWTGATEPMGDDAKDRAIVRAEKLPDGGYLNLDQRKDKAFFRLEVCRPVHEGSLCCTVIARSDKPLDAFDEIVGFAEKVCRSMKAS